VACVPARPAPEAVCAVQRASVAQGATLGDAQAGFDAKYGGHQQPHLGLHGEHRLLAVEADEQQIQSHPFNLLFPEKRDFSSRTPGSSWFGAGSFQGGGNNAGGGGGGGGGGGAAGGGGGGRTNQVGDNILFFSRRIGLSDEGNAIPILAGDAADGPRPVDSTSGR